MARRFNNHAESKGKGKGKGSAKDSGKGAAKGKGKGKTIKAQSGNVPTKHQGQGQYQKIKGTQIQHQKGGVVMRFVPASGKTFPVNDIMGVEAHLRKLEVGSAAAPWHPAPTVPKAQAKGAKGNKKGAKGKGESKGVAAIAGKGKGKKEAKGKGKGKGQSKGQGKGKGDQKEGKGKGKGKGAKKLGKFARKSKMFKKRKDDEDLTPEQLEKRAERKEKHMEKMRERHAARTEKEGRQLVAGPEITGEVVQRGKFFAWVKVDSAAESQMSPEVKSKLVAMNEESKAKASEGEGKGFCGGIDENVVYCAIADIEEEGLILKRGVTVKFALYTDNKGVGGCQLKSA